MARTTCSKLSFAFVACAVLACSTFSSAQPREFEGTTTENIESTEGLSDAELNALDAETRKQFDRFQAGRKDTSKGGDGRYSGILETHDLDFDGISDGHAFNGLETTMDKAAGRKTKARDGSERDVELATLRAKLANKECLKKIKARQDADPTKFFDPSVCNSISAVLVNKQAAHGDADNEHRVYDLTDEAKKAAEGSGKEYAAKTIEDASRYNTVGSANASAGKKPNTIIVTSTDASGQKRSVETTVAANPDLLRSEAAYLHEQVDRTNQNAWKFLRARKFAIATAGSSEDREISAGVARSYRGSSAQQAAEGDAKMAEVVALQAVFNGRKVCPDGSLPDATQADDKKCGGKGQVRLSELASKPGSKDVADLARAALRQDREKGNPEFKKDLAKRRQDILACMKENVFCDSSFKPVKGDPGDTFTDTREFQYHQAALAAKGPLSNYMKTVTNSDFNATNNPAAYAATKKSVEAAIKAEKDFATSQTNQETAIFGGGTRRGRNAAFTGAVAKQYDPRFNSARSLNGFKNNGFEGRTLGGRAPSGNFNTPSPRPSPRPQSNSPRLP